MDGRCELELTGPLSRIAFPPLCANCGAAASRRIRLEQVFCDSDSETGQLSYRVVGIAVPFCPACTTQHQREVRRVTLAERLLLLFRSWLVIPSIGSSLTALWFFAQMARRVAVDPAGTLFFGLACALFSGIASICWAGAWRDTRRHAVPPDTSVTSCFAFSDNRARLLEPQRRLLRMRNQSFAQALAACNRDRAWDPDSPRARAAAKGRLVLYVLFGIVLAAAIVWGMITGK